jgi:beta-1,4-mannosyltransferase
MDEERVVVLESFGPPHQRTNPYLTQLFASFPSSVTAMHFSWRRALTGSFDVFHLHWPEALARGATRGRTVRRSLLLLLVLLRIRLQRKALVRTLHNVTPHERPSRLQAWVTDLSERWTTLWITLNDRIAAPNAAPTMVVAHGHYRDWFADQPRAEPRRGRLLHFGRVRAYKGLDSLLEAFAELDDEEVSLHIVGKTEDESIASHLRRASTTDRRISVIDDYVSDAVLAREIYESELVVLPFTETTNSGSLLLALSLDRPVLVPAMAATDALAAEVGGHWVLTFQDRLHAATLERALDAARQPREPPRPDLSGRDWASIGAGHAAAFIEAKRHAGGR